MSNAWMEYYASCMENATEWEVVPNMMCSMQTTLQSMAKEGCIVRGERWWRWWWVVISSSIPSDVYVEGMVILETENLFVLLLREGRMRKMTKKGHVFEIVGLNGRKVLLYGDWLKYTNPYVCGKADSPYTMKYCDYSVLMKKQYYRIQFMRKEMADSTPRTSRRDVKDVIISLCNSSHPSFISSSTFERITTGRLEHSREKWG